MLHPVASKLWLVQFDAGAVNVYAQFAAWMLPGASRVLAGFRVPNGQ